MAKQQARTKAQKEPMIPRNWTEDRALSLGGAGASLLILLTTIQLNVANSSKTDGAYSFSMGCSAIAMVFWVCLWLIGDTDSYWRGKHPEKSLKTPLTRMWGPVVFTFAATFLLVSIGYLISTASTRVACMFAVAVVLGTIIALMHSDAVRKYMETAVATPRRLRKQKCIKPQHPGTRS